MCGVAAGLRAPPGVVSGWQSNGRQRAMWVIRRLWPFRRGRVFRSGHFVASSIWKTPIKAEALGYACGERPSEPRLRSRSLRIWQPRPPGGAAFRDPAPGECGALMKLSVPDRLSSCLDPLPSHCRPGASRGGRRQSADSPPAPNSVRMDPSAEGVVALGHFGAGHREHMT